MQRRLIDVFEQNRGAVLKVVAAFDAKEDDGRNFLLIGTGFYVSREGHILTNTNIVFGANRIWVERKGIAYAAEVVGHDPLTNVSILRARKLPHDFEFLRFSDMGDMPAVGSIVMSIGCELGLDPSPSMGLITGRNTQYVERVLPTIYLRTDIPYDGGEGGSPVFNINGALIGMIVAALPEIRSSFVLPARAVQRILNDIILAGEVTYAYFGFQSRQMANPERGPWVEVEAVVENSPAEEANILPGDVLLSIGDHTIETDDDLRVASFFTRPNRYVSISVKRLDEVVELSLMPTVREVPIAAMPPVAEDALNENITDMRITTETESALAGGMEERGSESEANNTVSDKGNGVAVDTPEPVSPHKD